MKSKPIWKINGIADKYPSLTNQISVDVAIIGGGITGITTAQFLKSHGFRIAVIESRRIAAGTTGQSTGNLYGITEYRLEEMISKYNLKTIQKVVLARMEALNHIQENVRKHEMDCDFHLQNLYLFSTSDEDNLEKERKKSEEIGLVAESLTETDFPFQFHSGIVFPDQAQMNPFAYTQLLAQSIYDENCKIFENSCVNKIKEKDDFICLYGDGFEVKAKYIVEATHTPKGLQIPYHTTLGPYREYGIAVKLKNDDYPQGIFWGQFAGKKYSVRSYSRKGEKYLICVGNMHKVGQAEDNRENIQDLVDFTKKHFDVASIEFEWGGQNYKPADMLPYIGKLKSGSKQYIATGFSTDGLIYGTVAAKIISDEIAGIKNEFSELFKANRHQPIKVAKEFVKENVDVAEKLIGDYFKKGEDQEIKDLLPDEGKLIQREEGKYAVYKNPQGAVTILSPICPHMKCTVRWNKAEKTWDCPCHGSRFDTAGRVIEGPAMDGLKKME